MTTYGIKYLDNGYSLAHPKTFFQTVTIDYYEKIYYPLNKWIVVPGNGSYVSHTDGLWSAQRQGTEYAIFECKNEVKIKDKPIGVKCWRNVKHIDNDELLEYYLDKCAEKQPYYALKYASNKLTPERLDWCAKQYPRIALKFASDKITPKRLDWCIKKYFPYYAFKFASDKLTLLLKILNKYKIKLI